ncbi:MAG: hypothetical protein AABZ15_03545 [Nitrospirota bacterium]
MDELINYIIFFSGTFFGGIVVYFARTLFEHRLAISRSIEAIRITEFNKAAADFRTAFVDYIYTLRHTKSMTDADAGWFNMREIHTETIERDHEKAKIRFEPFIDASARASFDAAWEKYRQWPEHFNNQDDKTERRDVILNHLYSLLKYANPKI